jgi:hypothetical protein
MWNTNDNRQGKELSAGSYFLQKLSEWQAGHREATIDLIRHSAGCEGSKDPLHFPGFINSLLNNIFLPYMTRSLFLLNAF